MTTINPLVKAIGRRPSTFTKDDIIRYIVDNDIKMVNFMYPAADGRLKTLNFVVSDIHYLDTILSNGERVDGSSLFPFIEAGNSDLYVIPRFATAFLDPFAPLPTLTMLCSFFDKEGKPLALSPVETLDRACREFTATTGLEFEAMGELEYYVIAPAVDSFPAVDQKGYHESEPFAKFNSFRARCMATIASIGGDIKYGHSEVGNFTLDSMTYEQNEIEFLPVDARRAADQLLLAKWVIRTMAHREGLNVTFAPKITVGKAGSGLHFHMRLIRDGENVMLATDAEGKRGLSTEARRLIAGLMVMARSLTAFGNTIPTSYFRLVPHQEAPTSVCWGDRNRSVLVRVPLGWTADTDMCAIANPGRSGVSLMNKGRQTVEIRSADASADIHLFLAGLAVAARLGWEMGDKALEIASKTYVDINIHSSVADERRMALESLPTTCTESANCLAAARDVYEAKGVFAPAIIDATIARLKDVDTQDRATVAGSADAMLELVKKYFYCG